MAPPDRGDVPRDTSPLAAANLTESSVLWESAARMSSWIEFLLHPEEHEYDRTVIYPDGEKREEPGPVTKANPRPGHVDPVDLPYESVLAGHHPSQFLHGMAAVATQRVQQADSILGIGADALYSAYWLGERQMASLVDAFPPDWQNSSTTGANAYSFLLVLQDVAREMHELLNEFCGIAARYAVIVKRVRDNLIHAAEELVQGFEDKFANKGGVSVNVVSVALTGIAAAAVTYLTAGVAAPAAGAAVTSIWSTMFTDAAKKLLTESKSDQKSAPEKIHGYWWRDIANSFLTRQAEIMSEAKEEVDALNDKILDLYGQVDKTIINSLLASSYGS